MPFLTPQGLGLRISRQVTLIIILLVSTWLPDAARPLPSSPPAPARGAAQSVDENLSLEPGKPIGRELSGGQSHFYKIAMIPGQYLRIIVNQQGIEVLMALFTPDGKKIG